MSLLRAPKTLWWYLWRELVRLLLLTTAVVVVVTSFAVSIKPLADGQIGPGDTLRLMLFASVPMLQYALPFAAGFAATLAYHRFASENEQAAAHAGGISHRALLVPSLATGVVLSGVLFLLADQAMPRLLRRMSEVVSSDVMRLMQNAFARGESINLDNRMFYADELIPGEPDPTSPGMRNFVLRGLVAAQLDPAGNVTREVCSKYAVVWMVPGPSRPAGEGEPVSRDSVSTTVIMKLYDSIIESQQTRIPGLESSTIVYTVPRGFDDNPKFLTWSELDEVAEHPERMNWIDGLRRETAAVLAERRIADALRQQLVTTGRLSLRDEGGRSVSVRAKSLGDAYVTGQGYALRGDAHQVLEVAVTGDDARTRTFRPARAFVAAPASPERHHTVLNIVMEEVGVAGEDSGVLAEHELTGLIPDDDPLPALLRLSPHDVRVQALDHARQHPGESWLAELAGRLEREVTLLRQEILSKQHERLAASLACLVMVMCGSVMAMRLRDSLPLHVYLWSFLPALGALFSISGGQSLTHTHGVAGLVGLYAGVVSLGIWSTWEYVKLARH